MSDDLIRYNSNQLESAGETKEESLSRQFYEWERRGRGWQVYDFPVELEPPFRPFYFFEPDQGPLVDDGRVPTFLSRVFGNSSTKNPSTRQSLQLRAERQSRYEEYIANADEPEFCGYYHEEFEAIELILPKDLKVIKSSIEHFLLSLAYCTHPVSFEVIGNAEKVVVQFAATQYDLPQLKQQIEAHMPEASLLDNTRDHLAENWLNTANSSVIADFGLSKEFFLPLDTVKSFDIDPLTTIIGAMMKMESKEVGIFQVLFQKAKHEWAREVRETIPCFDNTPFFDHIPDVYSQAKQKLQSPLYGVVLRVAAKSSDQERALRLVRNIGSGINIVGSPAGNELIPLSNDGYPVDHHEQALLDRQSFRSGMLLNTDELVSLVHPPSQVVRSEKLVRDNLRTKAAPNTVLGHSLVLGENRHLETDHKVTLSNDQRTRHIHIIGASGSGKSTLLLNLIKQDMEKGEGLCIIDPHGDLIEEIIASVPESRIDDCILFDPSDAEYPIGFNILQAKTDLEKTILSSDLVATFRRTSTSWGDVMDSVLANAVLAIIESSEGGTLFDLKRFLIEKDFRHEFLKTVKDESIRYFWTYEFPLLANKPQASILIRLDTFLRQKLVRNIVCQKESKLNFREIMDGKKILLLKLSQGLIGEENAFLLGTLLVSKIYQAALSRQDTKDRPYFWLYLDEFQHFITPSMEGILSGSRKYNLGLTLSHQEFRQLQSRNQEVASSVLSNCYTRICFRLGDTDAKKFANGFSFFDAKALQNLGIGEAVGRIERSEFDFNLTTSLLPKIESEICIRRKTEVQVFSRETFASLKADVEKELSDARSSEITDVTKESGDKKEYSVETRRINKEVELLTENTFAPLPQEENNLVLRTDAALPETSSNVQQTQQHRYLQNLLKRMAESKGFRVTLEKELFGGLGRIDVVLESETQRVACEISVTNTPEYEVQNIHKCISAGFNPIVLISNDPRHLSKIKRHAESNLVMEQFQITRFFTPEEFFNWLDNLIIPETTKGENFKGFKVNVNVKSTDNTEQHTKRRAISDVIFGGLKRLKK